jgi:N6-L-threonylcarbamoyladenine synthase
MLMLGIETSCDETSVALLAGDGTVRANLIASQIDRHQPFGGVVPEIASREHLLHLRPLIEQAVSEAEAGLADLTAIAVTSGPGLIGALLVGVAAAQGLSYGLGIPLVGVNHLEGHIYSSYLRIAGAAFPVPPRFLALVVSGGHSSIYDMHGNEVRVLNRTRDDAAGEVFDKVAKFVGLPYPGGPHVERIAWRGDPKRFVFPLPRFTGESDDFSFSGLKSNAIRLARKEGVAAGDESSQLLADFCASFQRAIVDQIIDRLGRIWRRLEGGSEAPTELALAGGVAANSELRGRIGQWGDEHGLLVRLPDRRYCTDNAAMIAFAGIRRISSAPGDPLRLRARSRMQVGE